MQAAEAAAELDALAQFFGAICARQYYGEHVCCAAQPDHANGSVEDLVDRGVELGAAATDRWAKQIVEAVSDKSSEGAILTALGGLHFDLAPLATELERGMLQSAMLGALDSEWERNHDEPIAPAKFTAQPQEGAFSGLPFADALNLFQQRKVLPKAAYDALDGAAKRQAFTVARMASSEMLNVTKAELARQLSLARQEGKGLDFRTFKTFAKERLESAGWTPANASHVETVFRTSAMGALASGRVAEMRQPAVLAAMPYWQIRGVNDSRTRPTHKAAHGIVLPANDPFWLHAYPPFGWNCRCVCCARTKRWLEANGVVVGPTPKGLPDPGFECGTAKMLLPVPAGALAKPPAPVTTPAPITPNLHPSLPVVPAPAEPSRWLEDQAATVRAQQLLGESAANVSGFLRQPISKSGVKSEIDPRARGSLQGFIRQLIPGAVSKDLPQDARKLTAVRDLTKSKRARGLHWRTGRMELDAKVAAQAADALARIGAAEYKDGRALTEEDVQALNGLRTFVHEELHGHSRGGTAGSYRGAGAVLEEVGTELTAREVVARSAHGLDADALREWFAYGGSYVGEIQKVLDIVAKHGGFSIGDARRRVLAAHGTILGKGALFTSEGEHLDAFVAGLDLSTERAQLVKRELSTLEVE